MPSNGLGNGFSSPAVSALGFGSGLGDALKDQAKTETDEERKKRLMAMSSPIANYSPAASMLLGGRGGGLGGV